MSKYLVTLAFIAIILPGCQTTEINLTHNNIVDVDKTAVIRTVKDEEVQRESGLFEAKVHTWLLAITDLSLAEAERKPIKLFNAFSSGSGDHPRVSPGAYSVRVGCEAILAYGASHKQTADIKIEAEAGKIYLLECMNKAKQAINVEMREVDQRAVVTRPETSR